MKPRDYFLQPNTITQKQYEALRSFFVDRLSAEEVAKKYLYTKSAFYSLVADFKKNLKELSVMNDPFFQEKKKGRREKEEKEDLYNIIIEMRKKNSSVPEIKTVLDAKGYKVSEKYVYLVLKNAGFARLPRRSKQVRKQGEVPKIKAEKSVTIEITSERFSSHLAGIFSFIPYLERYNIIQAIAHSNYPQTKAINKVSSILAFQALKLSNVRRYSADDLWCMDRGLGLFASLNVLPKVGWFSSYSHSITRDMNLSFLKSLHNIWCTNGLLGDSANLDFVTIPYWGENSHLENNWSGKRRQSLASMLSVLAHDPDSGIIDYGDTDVLHKNENAVVLEFLDFYTNDNPQKDNLKYLIFDSKFTTYENLNRLDEKGIKFVTIRRRGKKIVEEIESIAKSNRKKVRVMNADGKGRTLYVNDQNIILKGYSKKKQIRQIAITGHGKIKPALIITNDLELKIDDIIRKYSRRWLVEKAIAEHAAKLGSSYIKAIQVARKYLHDQNISHLQKSHQLMIQMRQEAEQMVEDAGSSMGKTTGATHTSTALNEVVNEVESMISTKEQLNVTQKAKADIEPTSISFNIKKKKCL